MRDKPTWVIRELRTYIENREINHINKSDQKSSARFLAEYGGLDIYYEYVKKKYIIDNGDVQYFKKRLEIFGIPHKPDGSSAYHKLLFIHEDLIDRIMYTHQNEGVNH